jgi:hypothetical protein
MGEEEEVAKSHSEHINEIQLITYLFAERIEMFPI